jgi:3-hydroxyacyl-CoA dehydrogenase
MSIRLIAVAGAGFMGTGIAESLASAAMCVLLYEPGRTVELAELVRPVGGSAVQRLKR